MSIRNLLFSGKRPPALPYDYYLIKGGAVSPFLQVYGYRNGVGVEAVNSFFSPSGTVLLGYNPIVNRLIVVNGNPNTSPTNVFDTSKYPFTQVDDASAGISLIPKSTANKGIGWSTDSNYWGVPLNTNLGATGYHLFDAYDYIARMTATAVTTSFLNFNYDGLLVAFGTSAAGATIYKRTGIGLLATYAAFVTVGAQANAPYVWFSETTTNSPVPTIYADTSANGYINGGNLNTSTGAIGAYTFNVKPIAPITHIVSRGGGLYIFVGVNTTTQAEKLVLYSRSGTTLTKNTQLSIQSFPGSGYPVYMQFGNDGSIGDRLFCYTSVDTLVVYTVTGTNTYELEGEYTTSGLSATNIRMVRRV